MEEKKCLHHYLICSPALIKHNLYITLPIYMYCEYMTGNGFKQIVLSMDIIEKLEKLKEHHKESYNDVVKRLLIKK